MQYQPSAFDFGITDLTDEQAEVEAEAAARLSRDPLGDRRPGAGTLMQATHGEGCHQRDLCAQCLAALIQRGMWCSSVEQEQEAELQL